MVRTKGFVWTDALQKAKAFVEAKGMECYVPLNHCLEQIYNVGKNRKFASNIISNRKVE